MCYSLDEDLRVMQVAIDEAKRSMSEGGIPIGAALVRDGVIIAKGHNRRVQDNDPLMHAEIDCIRNGGRIGRYGDTVLYSTLMPCYLCAGAVVQFGIPKVVVGESVNFAGAEAFLREKGIAVVNLCLDELIQMMTEYITAHPDIWNEDIGTL
ncbi:nucleoside deaminase [Methanogenium organophilum]|uniref:Nucleoside deaminase n=1 Tax=Methanogenium organophilum TaxID=2199 RepID=A0A9X9T9G5_METOG|nr:nucleoside deaminase [Methanogenium organophilum]WAI02082.1 nucleoside deaminase [Methanogenium organophilum]